tara:strand:- start:42 stop:518 length:477 start_codon:yes stop_codon:yes gene_type:complete
MIDSLAFMLPILILAAAVIKRSEMALWLALITGFAAVIGMSGAPIDSIMIFFSGANLILMTAGFSSWRANKITLPLLIGLLASINVVMNFTNLIALLNTGFLLNSVGMITGLIGYAQLVLVCTMDDSKGVLNELLNDGRDLLCRSMHMGGNNKNGGNH